jgi:oligopeptide transport system substrate-binding protein
LTYSLRAALLALGCFSSVVSPASAATLTLAHTPETLFAYPTAFGALDPLALVDCFEGLVAMDAKGDVIPGQASSWTISPDGLTYTFALRDDIFWSNGDAVSAQDFLTSFQWLLDPSHAFEFAYLQFSIDNAAEVAAGLAPIEDLGVKVIDTHTLEFVLERPAPYFLQGLTHSTAYPIPSQLLAQRGRAGLSQADLVCNGPYTITTQTADRIEAVLSDSYYARDTIAIDTVEYLAIRDVAEGLERFKAGEIDMIYDLPVSANAWIEAHAADQSSVVPFLGLSYLAVNFDKSPFDQKTLRQALSMAIDRARLDPQGVHSPKTAAHGVVPPGTANYESVDAYRPDWADWPYDRRIEEATAMLASLGYTAQNPLTLELRYSKDASDGNQQVARDVAAMWEAIGIRAELQPAASKEHTNSMRAGDFDVGRLTWILDIADPANILELMSQASEFNVGGYRSAELEETLSKASMELDLTRRAQILATAEARIIEDGAMIPLNWIIVRNLLAPGIEGIVDNAKNVHPTRWVSKAE